MGDKTVELNKSLLVEEKVDPLTGRQFSILMLFIDPFLATP